MIVDQYISRSSIQSRIYPSFQQHNILCQNSCLVGWFPPPPVLHLLSLQCGTRWVLKVGQPHSRLCILDLCSPDDWTNVIVLTLISLSVWRWAVLYQISGGVYSWSTQAGAIDWAVEGDDNATTPITLKRNWGYFVFVVVKFIKGHIAYALIIGCFRWNDICIIISKLFFIDCSFYCTHCCPSLARKLSWHSSDDFSIAVLFISQWMSL